MHNIEMLLRISLGAPENFSKLGDVHLPAAILKSFLRQLPEPLLTYDLYDHIIRVQSKLRFSNICCIFYVTI